MIGRNHAGSAHENSPVKEHNAYTTKLPFTFDITFEDNLLSLEWDFQSVVAHDSISTRHLLLLNSAGLTPFMEPVMLAKQYHRLLPLGDFMKVIDVVDGGKTGWL